MLTRLRVRNFKRFEYIDIPLGKVLVFIGPNNLGKTTALQALALWGTGLKKMLEKRSGKVRKERPGVTINRNDLISSPPSANQLWKGLHVRDSKIINGKQETKNVRIEIIVDGVTKGQKWSCGLEFDYANPESFYCRPLRIEYETKTPKRMEIPDEAGQVQISYLPPMSGLAAMEEKLVTGSINRLIGEGRTAQVLRNLSLELSQHADPQIWDGYRENIQKLFGVRLQKPIFLSDSGLINMRYLEPSDKLELDLSCSGRGLQQVMLLLAFIQARPNSILLLDEPDAHLEILRQRQIYNLLSNFAGERGSQIIMASHSEIVLNEAAGRDSVVAFLGTPHPLADRGSQLLKSLTDIGWEHYYQAKMKGWVLYLESPSDLAILRSLAHLIGHEASNILEEAYSDYVTNIPQRARERFYGLKEALPKLVGLAIFDRLDKELQSETPLHETMWRKREIESYICDESVLLSYARYEIPDDLFGSAERKKREVVMKDSIEELRNAMEIKNEPSPWSMDCKVTDNFLDPLFNNYFRKLELPNIMKKSSYHILAQFLSSDKVDAEVIEKLDLIVATSRRAVQAE